MSAKKMLLEVSLKFPEVLRQTVLEVTKQKESHR
eukprot:gene16324-4975_t